MNDPLEGFDERVEAPRVLGILRKELAVELVAGIRRVVGHTETARPANLAQRKPPACAHHPVTPLARIDELQIGLEPTRPRRDLDRDAEARAPGALDHMRVGRVRVLLARHGSRGQGCGQQPDARQDCERKSGPITSVCHHDGASTQALFLQSPSSDLSDYACPACVSSKFDVRRSNEDAVGGSLG